MNFVALDVETANSFPGSICSIGIVRFERGEVVDQFYSLIKPPPEMGEFSRFNIRVHGISPAQVDSAPNFSELYERLDSFLSGNTVAVHNSSFDARQLYAAMEHFGIEGKYDFACTLALSRRMLRLPDYKLPTVCNHLGIRLDEHHNALADAAASGRILYALSSKMPA